MMKVVKKWKDGRILVKQVSSAGLMGYDEFSPDSNRFMFYPNGTYKAHIWTGFAGKRDATEFDGRIYQFAGYY